MVVVVGWLCFVIGQGEGVWWEVIGVHTTQTRTGFALALSGGKYAKWRHTMPTHNSTHKQP
jgi:hypothetical protein